MKASAPVYLSNLVVQTTKGSGGKAMGLRNAFETFAVPLNSGINRSRKLGAGNCRRRDQVDATHWRRTNGLSLNDGYRTRTSVRRVMVGRVLGVLNSPLPRATGLLAKATSAEYRIVAAGSQFTALDPPVSTSAYT
jgi:hypothetical protein